MPITFYSPTSAYAAGAIKFTTEDLLSGKLKFRADLKRKFFDLNNATLILSSAKLSSNELLYSYTSKVSGIDIELLMESYSIGLSSTTSSELTSIDINPSTRVTINKNTGVISISSMTPGNYTFNYYGKISNSAPWSSVTLSASIPVTILSSTQVEALKPDWNLPQYVTIPPLPNSSGEVIPENSYVYTLFLKIERPTELDEIIAIYKNPQSQFALCLERGFDDSSYKWKFVINNSLPTT